MKKYLKVLIAVLVGIGAMSISSSVNAMTTQDLAGRVYRVTSICKGVDKNGEAKDMNFSSPKYVFINNKGKFISIDDPAELDNTDSDDKKEIEQTNKKINKLISSKKSARKTFKNDGEKYSVNENELKGLVPTLGSKATITSDDPNHLTATAYVDNERMRYFAANGDGVQVYYDLTLAPQEYQYKFKW